jgi:poly(hydroxyalkanoate) granule-associated protein
MATQQTPPGGDKDDPAVERIKESAHQIWLAGLGAFAKAQEEGSRVFEALVKDGMGMQKRTQQAAEETFSQAQARMAGLANEFGEKAAGQWGKLENIFEERVARALEKLGVPSANDISALQDRIAELEARLEERGPAHRKTAARKPAETDKPSRRHASKRGPGDTA